MTNPTRKEMIAILKPSGNWCIYPFNFPTDPGNNFRKVYPMKITVEALELEFMKVTASGRMMYKVVY